MNYLLIENKGEIDVNALILMGGSTKREDETKIGFFGSGNKYAIALLLKQNIDFKVFSGNKEVLFETEVVTFRDKTFEKIKVNGQDTSLTTDMGPQWQVWQAVREFVCNAIDENTYNFINSTSVIEAKEGYTRIYLPHIPEVLELINNWNSYFAFDRRDEKLNVVGCRIYPQIFENEELLLYRKQIRVYKGLYKSLYHYDIHTFDINESRVIENTFNASAQVARFLSNYATEEIAFNILKNSYQGHYWEHTFYWDRFSNKLNPNWRKAIGGKILIVDEVSGWFSDEQKLPHFIVTSDLAKIVRDSFEDVKIYGLTGSGNTGAFRPIEETPKIAHLLKKAQEFLDETKYEVNYPIRVGQFSKDNQLGGVGINEIHLSEKVFDLGIKKLVMVIVEENEHLNTKFGDCSRDFQNHWIQLYISEKEERFAYFL